MKKRNGFTLVELLAVIVILAIILVIAVPQIMNTIESSREGSIESSTMLIASSAERDYLAKQVTEGTVDTSAITCASVATVSSGDYGDCSIAWSEGTATVTLAGAGKFDGYSCTGTSTSATCTKNS